MHTTTLSSGCSNGNSNCDFCQYYASWDLEYPASDCEFCVRQRIEDSANSDLGLMTQSFKNIQQLESDFFEEIETDLELNFGEKLESDKCEGKILREELKRLCPSIAANDEMEEIVMGKQAEQITLESLRDGLKERLEKEAWYAEYAADFERQRKEARSFFEAGLMEEGNGGFVAPLPSSDVEMVDASGEAGGVSSS